MDGRRVSKAVAACGQQRQRKKCGQRFVWRCRHPEEVRVKAEKGRQRTKGRQRKEDKETKTRMERESVKQFQHVGNGLKSGEGREMDGRRVSMKQTLRKQRKETEIKKRVKRDGQWHMKQLLRKQKRDNRKRTKTDGKRAAWSSGH